MCMEEDETVAHIACECQALALASIRPWQKLVKWEFHGWSKPWKKAGYYYRVQLPVDSLKSLKSTVKAVGSTWLNATNVGVKYKSVAYNHLGSKAVTNRSTNKWSTAGYSYIDFKPNCIKVQPDLSNVFSKLLGLIKILFICLVLFFQTYF